MPTVLDILMFAKYLAIVSMVFPVLLGWGVLAGKKLIDIAPFFYLYAYCVILLFIQAYLTYMARATHATLWLFPFVTLFQYIFLVIIFGKFSDKPLLKTLFYSSVFIYSFFWLLIYVSGIQLFNQPETYTVAVMHVLVILFSILLLYSKRSYRSVWKNPEFIFLASTMFYFAVLLPFNIARHFILFDIPREWTYVFRFIEYGMNIFLYISYTASLLWASRIYK